MKALMITAWICLVVEVVAVLFLVFAPHSGADPAGRGMAAGFGLMLAIPVVIAGGAFIYGVVTKSSAISTGAAVVLVLPVAFWILRLGGSMTDIASKRMSRSRDGAFSDAQLKKVARAIDASDTALVKSLASQTKLNATQRDPHGRTILGYAVTKAFGNSGNDDDIANVRILLQSGVPWDDAAENEKDQNLFAGVTWSSGDKSLKLIPVMLEGGANPNVIERIDKLPLVFHQNLEIDKLTILANHGADLKVLAPINDNTGRRGGWTTLMFAVDNERWTVATFLLDHGVNPDVVSPGGESVATLLQEQLKYDSSPRDGTYRAFASLLAKKRGE